VNRTLRLLALAALPTALVAQATPAALDRTKVPSLGKPPVLKLPVITTAKLANGVGIQLVGQHEVPLVQVTLIVTGGSRLDGTAPGLAAFTTRLLTEGAGTRDANALQSELAFLGASLFANASSEFVSVSLNVPKKSLGAALDLMADVVLRPTFKASEVRKQRDLVLASILQRKDQPTQLAAIAFNQVMFPAGHPYHDPASGDSVTVAALDSAKVASFYRRSFVPARAKFVVVGDVSAAELQTLLAPRFGGWRANAEPLPVPAVTGKATSNDAIKVYLVDKPGAAQSVITIGAPGVDRLSPDYAALVVMNTILGGSFSSRLNSNLRETKGYTYGINSSFRWSPIAGPFSVSSSVRTNVTDSSLVEIFKELRSIRDTPVDAAELDRAKNYVALALPARFETNAQVANQLVDLGQYGLPVTAVADLGPKLLAVTAADVQRVARQYLPADKVTVVVVGDLAKIQSGIEALELGAITRLDVASIVR
jgi:predicted Zn-dependent peptidase